MNDDERIAWLDANVSREQYPAPIQWPEARCLTLEAMEAEAESWQAMAEGNEQAIKTCARLRARVAELERLGDEVAVRFNARLCSIEQRGTHMSTRDDRLTLEAWRAARKEAP